MSVIIILIPAVVLALMIRMKICSSPQSWWEWLLEPLPLIVWFGFPVIFAVLLFKDKKADKYFAGT